MSLDRKNRKKSHFRVGSSLRTRLGPPPARIPSFLLEFNVTGSDANMPSPSDAFLGSRCPHVFINGASEAEMSHTLILGFTRRRVRKFTSARPIAYQAPVLRCWPRAGGITSRRAAPDLRILRSAGARITGRSNEVVIPRCGPHRESRRGMADASGRSMFLPTSFLAGSRLSKSSTDHRAPPASRLPRCSTRSDPPPKCSRRGEWTPIAPKCHGAPTDRRRSQFLIASNPAFVDFDGVGVAQYLTQLPHCDSASGQAASRYRRQALPSRSSTTCRSPPGTQGSLYQATSRQRYCRPLMDRR